MNLTVAKTAGFCYGVQRAVEMAEETAKKEHGSVMLGPVIHNQAVIDHLARLGVGMIGRPEEAKPGQAVIIRSHGESRAAHMLLLEHGARITDIVVQQHLDSGIRFL